MRVFVYGTLKRGYGNNRLLDKAKFAGEHILPGYKLYNAGFPVARESIGDFCKGEIFEIADDDKSTLRNLDYLEGEGRMYNRVSIDEENLSLYVGHPNFWHFVEMKQCPKDSNGNFYWERT